VIATDVSNSINDTEAKLQREGTAEVFLDPESQSDQKRPARRIAVAMVDWSSKQHVVLDWTIVDGKESAADLAEKIRNIRARRANAPRSAAAGALLSPLERERHVIVAEKKVVDLSGDGPNNDGVSQQHFHDTTQKNGIIVNGLPIMDATSEGYYEDLDDITPLRGCGKGRLPRRGESYADFGRAMRRKLVLEISQNETQIKQALGLPANPLLKPVRQADRACR